MNPPEKRSRPHGQGRPAKSATTPTATSYPESPVIREGVYTKPLPLRARHLGPECWWLRDQGWAEIHLARLAGAWERVYGRAA